MNCKFDLNCRLKNSDYCTESCERFIKLNYLFEQSLIPDNLILPKSLYIDDDGSDRDAFTYLKSIQNNIEVLINNGLNIYLYSQIPGNGKTSWSVRLLKAYIYSIWHKCDMRTKVLFINVPRYLLELKSNIEEKSEYITHIKHNVLDCELVVWDDIATKSATEFEHEHLLSMIDFRLSNKKSNIFTSNVTPNDLHNLLGSRLASRVINESRIIQFIGKDKRGLEWKIEN